MSRQCLLVDMRACNLIGLAFNFGKANNRKNNLKMGRRKSVKKSHLKLTGEKYQQVVLNGSPHTENRDCTVRALMHATGVPYWQAHRFMAKHGRKMKAGGDVWSAIGRNGKVVFGHRFGKMIRPKKTVGKFIKQHPTGTFYVVVIHHAFCIKDGKVLGWCKSLNQHIEYYWRVTNLKGVEKPANFHAIIPKEILDDNKMLPTFEPMKERTIFDVHRERVRLHKIEDLERRNNRILEFYEKRKAMREASEKNIPDWNDPEVKHEMKLEQDYEKIREKEYQQERQMEHIEAAADREADELEKFENRKW